MSRKNKKEHDLVIAVREMVAHARGEIDLPTRIFTPPETVNVEKIRRDFGYSQQQFAEHFGFTVSAVRDWEQGRRQPERAARILLTMIAVNPKAVEAVMAQI